MKAESTVSSRLIKSQDVYRILKRVTSGEFVSSKRCFKAAPDYGDGKSELLNLSFRSCESCASTASRDLELEVDVGIAKTM